MKSKEGISDADLNELLAKIEKVSTHYDVYF
jgi:hypothetical protein